MVSLVVINFQLWEPTLSEKNSVNNNAHIFNAAKSKKMVYL